MIQWSDIKDYPNYQISSDGFVRNKKYNPPRPIKATLDTYGYRGVCLCNKGKIKRFKIAILVAKHFIENPSNFKIVNHINGIKTDDRIENLEWCTAKYNTKHAIDTGLFNPIGSSNGSAKLSNEEVLKIREIYLQGNISQRALAKQFGVSQRTILRITKKTGWRHL